MKLEQIEYVAKIEQFHSINQAAKSMYFTQPFLSSSIRQLEEELGFKIFTRNTQGVSLTDEGKEFLCIGRQIQDLVLRIENIGKKTKEKRKLSICYIHSYYMLDLLNNFVQNAGFNIDLDMCEMENLEVYQKVKDNPDFIGIAFQYGEGFDNCSEFCKENNLEFIEFYQEPIYAVVGKHNSLFSRDSITYEDLKPFEAVTDKIRKEEGEYQYTMAPFLQKHFRMSNIVFDNNRSKLYFLSKSSEYFGLNVKWFERGNPLIENEEIKFIPIADAETKRSIGIVVNRQKEKSHIENQLIEKLIKNVNTDK